MPIKPTYHARSNWSPAITLIAALSICLGGYSAQAQPSHDSSSGLPQPQSQGKVIFISGGVGPNESKAILNVVKRWPLLLSFSSPNRDYLTGVRVYITDQHGGEVLQADSRGPYMLVNLPSGEYIVRVRYQENEQTQPIKVAGKGEARITFLWNA
ncbi:carboxypeptidase-like regulatory domain-containing protein [Mycoavidus sp. B2-EB]|uniref:carboxypeptidase-like regulatory domain-containing protein n=1 Tax=Mycoavidus sp. B2-EB TaxID=2651972 RepID=UPI00162712DE|nr:carboxypeptidase-like regulatory domain-containing protein [Mycoavidus sp. B2-EB]BBO60205.1 hypothetical protein MPB2EB_1345 [Mycoavidus sp. B2-EB]